MNHKLFSLIALSAFAGISHSLRRIFLMVNPFGSPPVCATVRRSRAWPPRRKLTEN
jgi:hypothetical protein